MKQKAPGADPPWLRMYRLRFPYKDPSPHPSYDAAVISSVPEMDDWIRRLFSPFLRDVISKDTRFSGEEAPVGAVFRLMRDGPNTGKARGQIRIRPPGSRSASEKRPEGMAGELEFQVIEHVSWNLTRYSQIHAAFVAKEASGLLIPGRTHIGKTTLALTLWELGWTMYSDDLAVLQPESGLFLPFPRALKLEGRTLEHLKAPALGYELRLGPPDYSNPFAYFHPSWLSPKRGEDHPPKPVEARWIVFPRRRERARKKPELRPLTRGQALRRLVPHSYATHEFGVRGLEILSDLASRTEPYELVLGLPGENCRLIDEVLGGG